jgi:hypothetical protein
MVHYLYQGEEVYNMRPAPQPEGSSGSDKQSEQVIIMLKDGTDKTVDRREIQQK